MIQGQKRNLILLLCEWNKLFHLPFYEPRSICQNGVILQKKKNFYSNHVQFKSSWVFYIHCTGCVSGQALLHIMKSLEAAWNLTFRATSMCFCKQPPLLQSGMLSPLCVFILFWFWFDLSPLFVCCSHSSLLVDHTGAFCLVNLAELSAQKVISSDWLSKWWWDRKWSEWQRGKIRASRKQRSRSGVERWKWVGSDLPH